MKNFQTRWNKIIIRKGRKFKSFVVKQQLTILLLIIVFFVCHFLFANEKKAEEESKIVDHKKSTNKLSQIKTENQVLICDPIDKKYSIEFCENLGGPSLCKDVEFSKCTLPQDLFLKSKEVIGQSSFNSEEDIWAKEEWCLNEVPSNEAIELEKLRLKLISKEGMNIEYLLDKINQISTRVRIIEREEKENFFRERMVIETKMGSLEGILLSPKGSGPHPVVVVVHGHGQEGMIQERFYHGYKYPQNGLAAFFPTLTLLNLDDDEGNYFEHRYSLRMLKNGHTNIGFQLFLVGLSIKYLQFRKDIDDHLIGVTGHSHGAVLMNLGKIVFNDVIKFYVTDSEGGDYLGRFGDCRNGKDFPECTITSEFTPPICFDAPCVQRYLESDIETLKVKYNSSRTLKGVKEIIEFHKKNLGVNRQNPGTG